MAFIAETDRTRPGTPLRKGRNPSKPKGRELDEEALKDVRRLLGVRERRRDLLIEFLHLIQDEFRCLQAKHIRALAEEMRLSQVEVYEVASFYDHFDVVREGDPIPAPLTVRVCNSVTCMCFGADALLAELKGSVDPEKVRVVEAPCMGGCDVAPVLRVGDREIANVTAEKLKAVIEAGDTGLQIPGYKTLDAYRAEGGYGQWDKVRTGILSREDVIEKLSDAQLRGLGGAGFQRAGNGGSFAPMKAPG